MREDLEFVLQEMAGEIGELVRQGMQRPIISAKVRARMTRNLDGVDLERIQRFMNEAKA